MRDSSLHPDLLPKAGQGCHGKSLLITAESAAGPDFLFLYRIIMEIQRIIAAVLIDIKCSFAGFLRPKRIYRKNHLPGPTFRCIIFRGFLFRKTKKKTSFSESEKSSGPGLISEGEEHSQRFQGMGTRQKLPKGKRQKVPWKKEGLTDPPLKKADPTGPRSGNLQKKRTITKDRKKSRTKAAVFLKNTRSPWTKRIGMTPDPHCPQPQGLADLWPRQ